MVVPPGPNGALPDDDLGGVAGGTGADFGPALAVAFPWMAAVNFNWWNSD